MSSPAGAVTNVGKMAAVGLVTAGTAAIGLHALDLSFGHTGTIYGPPGNESRQYNDPSDAARPGTAAVVARKDGWRVIARTGDAAIVLAGGVSAAVGAAIARSDLSVAAQALGESATDDAVRAGKILTHSETLIGLGIGSIIATCAVARVSNLLELRGGNAELLEDGLVTS